MKNLSREDGERAVEPLLNNHCRIKHMNPTFKITKKGFKKQMRK